MPNCLATLILYLCLTVPAAAASIPASTPWWQRAVIYQIYPRSFQDSTGDGVGDLQGIIKRAPYLKQLGVDAVWLSPVYRSPMDDFGYDVSDYQAVDPLFGSMADLEQLIEVLHTQGTKVIMDLVANHTSAQHPWFVEARASKSNPKRDWYVWHDPAPGGGPPNNWRAVFAGPAWTLDEATGQYYYHAFLPSQPDLNWRHPEVRKAMQQMMRFWLDKGIDGFRVDAIGQLVEDAQFRDEPRNLKATGKTPDYDHFIHDYTVDQPETHAFLRELRQVVDSYPGDRMLISEDYVPIPTLMTYYGTPGAEQAQLPFNFYLIAAPWQAKPTANYVQDYEKALGAANWPNWVLGNHDRSRLATRLGPAQARVAAMLLLTLRGTPTLYYGDELGMRDVPISKAMVQDPWEKRDPGKGLGRDAERTPLPWDISANAGFTAGRPWLPLGADWRKINVKAQQNDAASTLRLYQQLLALRHQNAALTTGAYTQVFAGSDVFVYKRSLGQEQLLVALNFSNHPQTWTGWEKGSQVLVSTVPGALPAVGTQPRLRPNEGLVVRLPGDRPRG